MRGIKQDDFSKFLKESFLSIWVDNESGFGTYPIESMISGTPIIGKIPNLKPEWMNENNGIWTQNFNEIVDIAANFTQNWLEDNINEVLYENMINEGKTFQNEEKYKNVLVSLFEQYFETRKDIFKTQLEKIKITEENL
jgi:glycosyltransferase involved in cell wall biosynthesis